MSNVSYLGACLGNIIREVADDVDAGEITHAVLVYRTAEGDLKYRCIGADEQTYLIGMLARVQSSIAAGDFDLE